MATADVLTDRGRLDGRFMLEKVGWTQYLAISDIFKDRPGLRFTFLDGRLTLLSPSRRHDWHAERLGMIVVAVAQGLGIVWEDAAHATYRAENVGGVEGDKAYYFGDNADRMLGPVDIDLSTQPPPDLVIEVEYTHPADDAVVVWGRLGVPEVWRFDVGSDSLSFWRRLDDGRYEARSRSTIFPVLEVAEVLDQLRRAEAMGASRWFAGLDRWVRESLAPRVDPG